MVRVDVDVQQPRRRERAAEGSDDLPVSPLGEVRHGLEHDSYSRRVKAYYEARAPEYDDWWLGTGSSRSATGRAGSRSAKAMISSLAAMPPARTLDVACGTGFLTRHLPGAVTGLDQSASMLELASGRVPDAAFVRSDALRLPFQDETFERVFTSHFYGHLEEPERGRFLAEARRVAPELVVVDSALRDEVQPAEQQERILERRLALAGLQALLPAGRAGRRARRRRDPLRGPLVRGRTISAMTKVAPFIRVADAELSAEWYARLGFSVEWRTRAQPHLPLFVAISNGDALIFLSEHTGDAHPDGLLYIYVDDVDAIAADFGKTAELAYYGMREIELTDPDGNRLRIGTAAAG